FQFRQAIKPKTFYLSVFDIFAEQIPSILKLLQGIRLDMAVCRFILPILLVCKSDLEAVLYRMQQAVKVFRSLWFSLFEMDVVGKPIGQVQYIEGIKGLQYPFVHIRLFIKIYVVDFFAKIVLDIDVVQR